MNKKLYQPSNGSEGEGFMSGWCGQCARDALMNGTKHINECDYDDFCPIANAALVFDRDDENYPQEWTYDKDGKPCCTAFVHMEDPPVTPRIVTGKPEQRLRLDKSHRNHTH